MVDIIVNYWLEWVLGLIALGLGGLAKKFYSLYQAEKKHQKTAEQQKFYDDLKAAVKEASSLSREEEHKLQDQINIIKDGVLSIQGRIFKQECRAFLEPSREFTLEEFEDLQDEHDIYNSLGGNHDGDKLFNLVSIKADKILTDEK